MQATAKLSSVAATIALIASSILLMGDNGAALAEDQSVVVITVEVSSPCEPGFGPSFNPYEFGALPPMSAGDTSQRTEILLDILDGETSNCDPIFASVTFTETGFGAAGIDYGFDCDEDPISAVGGEYTCSAVGGSPNGVGLTVDAVDGVAAGFYDNTLTFTLIAQD